MIDGHRKYKCQNHNQNIEKNNHHRLIAAHIISGKLNCLIAVTGNITLNHSLFSQNLQQAIRLFLLLYFIFRHLIISPGIAVVQCSSSKTFKSFFRHHCHTEFDSIEHHIPIIRKQSAIIRQCHKTCHFQFFCTHIHNILHFNLIVVCIHSVYGNLICVPGHTAFHQTHQIYFRAVCKNSQRTVIPAVQIMIRILFHIKIRNNHHLFLFQPGNQRLLCPFFQNKMPILNLIFFKAFFICLNHTAACYQKPGDKADRCRHK